MALTPSQMALLEYITNYRGKYGYAPSQLEIRDHFGYRSLGTVQGFLKRLREQGLLEWSPHARRGLSAKPQKSSVAASVSLPLVGQVAAGKPIEAIETLDRFDVPASFVKRGEHIVLKVVGSSMIEEGILSGDHIIVKKQRTCENGQMIVALVDESATVKRFFKKKNVIELHPANPEFKPIFVKPEQSFHVEGVVVGVVRRVSK